MSDDFDATAATAWAKLNEQGEVVEVGSRPASWTNPDGTTTVGSPDSEMTPETIDAIKAAGYLPVHDESPSVNQETHSVVHLGYTVESDRVVSQYEVREHPVAEPTPPPDWYAMHDQRIDGIESLFLEVRDRYDAALHTIEEQANLMRAAGIDDRVQVLDRLIARLRIGLGIPDGEQA